MDLEKFSASSEDITLHQSRTPAKSKKKVRVKRDLPRHGSGDRFIKGPIPLDWLRAANTCGRKSVSVATMIWFAAGLQRSNPVKLSPAILSELAIPSRTAKQVLERMQDVGIVTVEFHRGRSPMVTILDAPALGGGGVDGKGDEPSC